ncbi:MAG: tetratricopeptide repeat protein [Pyrinomonadaceae bacterium]
MKTLFDSVDKSRLLLASLLVVVTLAAYEPVRSYEFVDYDDDRYVTTNARIQQGLSWNNAAWALTATEVANWHPLTWLSHMMDCQLYGLNPAGHHLTNLLLHLANVIILFLLLQRMTGATWRSWLVAALFAAHPLNIESVAWIAERKNVLSTLFWLLTMWAYMLYARRPGWKPYLLVLGMFVMGLMSKPMLVTLPCVLLLLDYWPLERLTRHTVVRLLLEKAPLFLLAAASSAITIKAQRMDGALGARTLSLSARLSNALVSYVGYIVKMFWPDRLAVLYPHPGESIPGWRVMGAALALVCVTVLVLRVGRKFPYLPVGWLWYLGTLVPVIGLVQVGQQAMADRYAYVPLIGLFIIIAWGVEDLSRRLPSRRYWLAGAAVALLIALTFATRWQLRYWQNSITLFERALDVTANNEIAHNNLGAVLVRKGRLDEGLAHFYEAVRLYPEYGTARDNIAITLSQKADIIARDESRWQEAVEMYRQALEWNADRAEARRSLEALLEKIEKRGQ